MRTLYFAGLLLTVTLFDVFGKDEIGKMKLRFQIFNLAGNASSIRGYIEGADR